MKFGEGKELSSNVTTNTQDLEVSLAKLNDGESIRLRLIGEINPAYRFWVKTRQGKNRPVTTPYFDINSENIHNDDPLLGHGRKEFFYTINCFVRPHDYPKSGSGELKVLILKTTVYRTLRTFALDPEYGDPTDSTSGYDIILTKERTGPLPMNIKYNVRPGRSASPLTPAEADTNLHNLEELYKPMSKPDYLAWIKENTDYLDSLMMAEAANPAYGVSNTAVNEDDIPF